MSYFTYPESWRDLQIVPSARWELIKIVEDVSNWNTENSAVKGSGSDSIIDFLFNVYEMDKDTDKLVNIMIFSNELPYLKEFISQFDQFVNEWAVNYGSLNSLHEAILPSSVTEAAHSLYMKLKERGLPKPTKGKP